MSFGKYTYGDHPNIHWNNKDAKLVVGKFCSLASNINIYLGGNHRTDWVTTYPFGHINKNVFTFHGQGHPTTKRRRHHRQRCLDCFKCNNNVWYNYWRWSYHSKQ